MLFCRACSSSRYSEMCIPTLQICGFTPGTSRVFRSRSEQKPQRPSQSCEPSGHTSIEPKAASQHKPWVHESKASRAKCLMIWGGLRRTWASAPSQKKMSLKASRCRDQWAGSSWRSKPCFESEVESAKNELMPEIWLHFNKNMPQTRWSIMSKIILLLVFF